MPPFHLLPQHIPTRGIFCLVMIAVQCNKLLWFIFLYSYYLSLVHTILFVYNSLWTASLPLNLAHIQFILYIAPYFFFFWNINLVIRKVITFLIKSFHDSPKPHPSEKSYRTVHDQPLVGSPCSYLSPNSNGVELCTVLQNSHAFLPLGLCTHCADWLKCPLQLLFT